MDFYTEEGVVHEFEEELINAAEQGFMLGFLAAWVATHESYSEVYALYALKTQDLKATFFSLFSWESLPRKS